jgi:hypothetical protein
MIDNIILSVGIIVFLVGFFFLGKAQGQSDCANRPDTEGANRSGGWVGLTIGIIFTIIAIVMKFRNAGISVNTNRPVA